MFEVVRCPDATDDKTAAEFASLVPPAEQCDEPLPPYKIIKPVYDGQFTDTFPQIDSSGILIESTGTVAECLDFPSQLIKPELPEVVRRFRAQSSPRHGRARVPYGQTYDKERQISRCLRHGVPTRYGINVKDLVNPPPPTRFVRHLNDVNERVYESSWAKPIGKPREPCLPAGFDPCKVTFGVWMERDISAGQLIHPQRSPSEVDSMAAKGHDLYCLTSGDYLPGEQRTRYYAHPSYDPCRRFGMPTPHDNEGTQTRKTLRWLNETEGWKASAFTSRVEDDFRERTQWQLGKTRDPIRDTLNVPLDHSFGYCPTREKYGMAELIHMRPEGRFLRGRNVDRSAIAVIRNHLKKANFQSFDNLLHAFKFYDKDQKGRISKKDLYETCLQFNIPINNEQLIQLFDYCDVNNDGWIDYVEFSNFLNWKNPMHSGFPKPCEAPCGMKVENSRPVTLEKQIDCAYDEQRTSSSMINAVVGGVDPASLRKYGVPSVRSDLPAPRVRHVDDWTNYGDVPGVWAVINPSVFSQHGVYERDVLQPRSRQELREIFDKIGVSMPCETFNRLYDLAAERSPLRQVSVDAFRGVLEQAQEAAVDKYKDTLGY